MTTLPFSDEQLAGQRLIAGFEGTALNNDLRYFIDTLKIGGVVLFSRNLTTPEQIKDLCLSVQRYARANGQPPLIIAIDQEGGTVARLKAPFTLFPGNSKMKDKKEAEHFARVTAKELNDIGVNMNLAPVMDVLPLDISTGHFVMTERAFGNDPQWVGDMGVTIISCLQQQGIMAVAKHFPGIGRTTLDSHQDMPVLDTDKEALSTTDLVPFNAAIHCGVAGIMLSHIRYRPLDSRWPASLSRPIACDLLRHQMGFKGITMTDDLEMGAIVKYYDIPTAISQILHAEVDVAMICRQRSHVENAFTEIVKLIKDDDLIKAKGEAAVDRIMAQKERYCYRENTSLSIAATIPFFK